jgi:TolB protein
MSEFRLKSTVQFDMNLNRLTLEKDYLDRVHNAWPITLNSLGILPEPIEEGKQYFLFKEGENNQVSIIENLEDLKTFPIKKMEFGVPFASLIASEPTFLESTAHGLKQDQIVRTFSNGSLPRPLIQNGAYAVTFEDMDEGEKGNYFQLRNLDANGDPIGSPIVFITDGDGDHKVTRATFRTTDHTASTLDLQTIKFLPPEHKNQPLYQEFTLLLDWILAVNEEKLRLMTEKYSNYIDLEIAVVDELIQESGYSYILGASNLNTQDKRTLYTYLRLISILKGSKRGYEFVLSLLPFTTVLRRWFDGRYPYQRLTEIDPEPPEFEFTVDSGGANPTYITTTLAHPFKDGSIVEFETDGTLPKYIFEDTIYQVKYVDDFNFEITGNFGGEVLTFESNGSGTHKVFEKVGNNVPYTLDLDFILPVTEYNNSLIPALKEFTENYIYPVFDTIRVYIDTGSQFSNGITLMSIYRREIPFEVVENLILATIIFSSTSSPWHIDSINPDGTNRQVVLQDTRNHIYPFLSYDLTKLSWARETSPGSSQYNLWMGDYDTGSGLTNEQQISLYNNVTRSRISNNNQYLYWNERSSINFVDLNSATFPNAGIRYNVGSYGTMNSFDIAQPNDSIFYVYGGLYNRGFIRNRTLGLTDGKIRFFANDRPIQKDNENPNFVIDRYNVAVNRGSTKMLYSLRDRIKFTQQGIWEGDLEEGEYIAKGNSHSIPGWGNVEYSPYVSPSRSRQVYQNTLWGKWQYEINICNIYQRQWDDASRRVYRPNIPDYTFEISYLDPHWGDVPDGIGGTVEKIVYHRQDIFAGENHLYWFDADELNNNPNYVSYTMATEIKITDNDAYNEFNPFISQDGQWLVFVSDRGGANDWQVWRVQINSSGPIPGTYEQLTNVTDPYLRYAIGGYIGYRGWHYAHPRQSIKFGMIRQKPTLSKDNNYLIYSGGPQVNFTGQTYVKNLLTGNELELGDPGVFQDYVWGATFSLDDGNQYILWNAKDMYMSLPFVTGFRGNMRYHVKRANFIKGDTPAIGNIKVVSGNKSDFSQRQYMTCCFGTQSQFMLGSDIFAPKGRNVRYEKVPYRFVGGSEKPLTKIDNPDKLYLGCPTKDVTWRGGSPLINEYGSAPWWYRHLGIQRFSVSPDGKNIVFAEAHPPRGEENFFGRYQDYRIIKAKVRNQAMFEMSVIIDPKDPTTRVPTPMGQFVAYDPIWRNIQVPGGGTEERILYVIDGTDTDLYPEDVFSPQRGLMWSKPNIDVNSYEQLTTPDSRGTFYPQLNITQEEFVRFPFVSYDGTRITFASDEHTIVSDGYNQFFRPYDNIMDAIVGDIDTVNGITNRTRVTNFPSSVRGLSMSPDKDYIAFYIGTVIHIVNLTTASLPLTSEAGGTGHFIQDETVDVLDPIFSHDGNWLYWTYKTGDGLWHIRRASFTPGATPSLGAIQELTVGQGVWQVLRAVPLPDNRRVLVRMKETDYPYTDQWHLAIVPLYDSTIINSYSDTNASYSPNEDNIIFASDRDGDRDLYIAPLDDLTNVFQLTNDGVASGLEDEWGKWRGPSAFPDPPPINPESILPVDPTSGTSDVYTGEIYYSKNGQIHRISPEGGGEEQLTDISGAVCKHPAILDDGKLLAFTDEQNFPNSDIYTINLAGGDLNLTKIFDGSSPPGDENQPLHLADMPLSKKILLSMVDTVAVGTPTKVYRMDYDGSNITEVYAQATSDRMWNPKLSNNEEYLIFDGQKDVAHPNFEIYRVDFDNGTFTGSAPSELRLTSDGNAYFGNFSSNDQKIYFLTNQLLGGGTYQVYEMNPDGTGKTRITQNDVNYGEFGLNIASSLFVTTRDIEGEPDLVRIDVDEGNEVQLTDDAPTELYPVWSRGDSQITIEDRIIFVSDITGTDQIWLYNPKWEEEESEPFINLSKNTFNDIQPEFNGARNKIVFSSDRNGNNQIYEMELDGSYQRRITDNAFNDYNPTYNQDGTEIAFHSNEPGDLSIYKVNVDGTGRTQLYNSPGNDSYNPAWRVGTDQDITFARNNGGNPDIFKVDGTNLTNTVGVNDIEPNYNPAGDLITFSKDTAGNNDLWVMDNTGGALQQLTNSSSWADNHPVFSNDASLLYFETDQNGTKDIYGINALGGGRTGLIVSPSNNRSPYPIEIGTPPERLEKVVFTSDHDTASNKQIYIMDLYGYGVTRITNDAHDYNAPMFSRDGLQILFTTNKWGTNKDIGIANIDGSNVQRVTADDTPIIEASFDPNGLELIYMLQDGDNDLYKIEVDGSNKTLWPPTTVNNDNVTHNAWSVSTDEIVYDSSVGGISHEIFKANSDGTGVVQLTSNGSIDYKRPSFNYAGDKVAFHINPGTGQQIFTMNSDGTGLTTLYDVTAGSDSIFNPIFSRDDLQVLFIKDINASGNRDIWSIDLDGNNPLKLTSLSASSMALPHIEYVDKSYKALDLPLRGLYRFIGDSDDYSGNARHATLNGLATICEDYLVIGYNNIDYLELPTSVLQGATNFTISCWAKINILQTGNINTLLSASKVGQPDEFVIKLDNTLNQWQVTYAGVNYSFANNEFTDIFTDLQWHHFALVVSGTEAILYIDGEFGDQITVPGGAIDLTGGNLFIGQEQDTVGGTLVTEQAWAGHVDNLIFVDTDCSSIEVKWLYDYNRGVEQLPNTTKQPVNSNVDLKFVGDSALDVSGNGWCYRFYNQFLVQARYLTL